MKRKIFLSLGVLFVGIGAIGVALPVLPTTPFILLAAFFFSRSSKKADEWLLKNKYFGSYIKNYRNKVGVPIDVKIHSLIFLWTIMLISIFIVNKFHITILLICIAIIVSAHIL
ncbi:YbaN family protein, partial [Methanobrevibacter sp. OttesenSCG-928-K11]|nr:YbaN family protein [Methanobrevibacter sp. OttesenSCG-928-K11]